MVHINHNLNTSRGQKENWKIKEEVGYEQYKGNVNVDQQMILFSRDHSLVGILGLLLYVGPIFFTANKAITTTRKVRWDVDKLRKEEQHEA